MTIETFNTKIDQLINNLPLEVRAGLEVVASDGIFLLQQRLLKGVNADDQPWRPYSDQYLEYKISKGKYTGKVNFKLTGEMFASTGIISSIQNGNRITVTIGLRDQFNKQKMLDNEFLRPGIMQFSKSEQRHIRVAFAQDIIRFAKRTIQ